jgi:hypothetical protein
MKAINPFIGTWDLNLANSKFINEPTPFSFRSATKVIMEGPEGSLTGWGEGILPDGSPFREWMEANKPDGKFRPHEGNPLIDTLSTERIDSSFNVFTTKKGDKIVGAGTRMVSPDGKVLTMTFIYLDAEGIMRGHVARYDKRDI